MAGWGVVVSRVWGWVGGALQGAADGLWRGLAAHMHLRGSECSVSSNRDKTQAWGTCNQGCRLKLVLRFSLRCASISVQLSVARRHGLGRLVVSAGAALRVHRRPMWTRSSHAQDEVGLAEIHGHFRPESPAGVQVSKNTRLPTNVARREHQYE